MRITIIVDDGAVYKDGSSYMNLSWKGTPANVRVLQWQDNSGWVEFNDGTPNLEITSLPTWVDKALAAWDVASMPTPDLPPDAEANKAFAVAMLSQTDWATIPDISDPTKNTPYLTNVDDFVTYRSQIRAVAINPVDGTIVWPIMPKAVWGS